MSAKKQAVKQDTKKTATKTVAKATFKKNDKVVFIGWDGPEPEYEDEDERIEKGMIGRVLSANGKDLEVSFELGDDSTVVDLTVKEVKLATKADIEKAAAMAESDEDEDEEEDAEDGDEDEDEEEESLGALADAGDKKAERELKKAAKTAGIDPDEYDTWVEVEEALAGDESEEEEESDEDESEEEDEDEFESMSVAELRALCVERGLAKGGSREVLIERLSSAVEEESEDEDEDEDEETTVVDESRKPAAKVEREKSLGRKADEGDKAAIRELTKRAKAIDLDPEDADNGETWTQFERTLKVAEKEASRPELKITKSVTAEIAEDGDDAIAAAKRLVETAEKTYYTLGGVLAVISRKNLHEGVKVKGEFPYQGQPGFKQFCLDHLGVDYRKAQYLINIYEAFTNAGLTEAKIGSIGWSKARHLVAILEAEPDAAEKWIETAKASSTDQVIEAVKTRLEKIGAKQHGNSRKTRTVTCKFVVHEDEGKVVQEALAMAKEQGDLKDDSEAFAYIVKEWMTFQS